MSIVVNRASGEEGKKIADCGFRNQVSIVRCQVSGENKDPSQFLFLNSGFWLLDSLPWILTTGYYGFSLRN